MSTEKAAGGVSSGLKGVALVVALGLAYVIQKFTGIDVLSKLTQDTSPAGATTVEAPADPKAEARDAAGQAPAKSDTSKSAAPQPKPTSRAEEVPSRETKPGDPKPAAQTDDGVAQVRKCFQAQQSSVWVKTQGKVVFVLPDDNYEPRHQNFLLQLAPDLTVKVSHNIDDAPYLDGLKKGDSIQLQGRYEYNEKGGVIHFTHRADYPTQAKPGGWIDYQGKRYQ
ncbi:MAG: DUF3465 domain-containing protein [Planctomycetes bacterium]|nr:DUF3465 domain-containing protein [Planctomycetota bacterium]MCB9910795.1 DUF3465 domain-containing protein [Planctomycetota bacterium]MCB9912822.1 DUF3465 domain-containing protein [Planctomycetota bacterium]HPF13995.1 DUF3465 domain-containing protein [Planctomycetota bacterium]HRV80210.1 DUF3465 domain-containing protein [Planctomycetota bacterium]